MTDMSLLLIYCFLHKKRIEVTKGKHLLQSVVVIINKRYMFKVTQISSYKIKKTQLFIPSYEFQLSPVGIGMIIIFPLWFRYCFTRTNVI